MGETRIHYCRWDWCTESFTSAEHLKSHVEEHVRDAIPTRKSDVELVLRAEGNSIRTSMIYTPDPSLSPSKLNRVDVAIMTESTHSFASSQPPPPPPLPSESSPPSPWFVLSDSPLVTASHSQTDPTQQWQPQSQLPLDFGNSLTSVDPSQLSIYK